MKRTPITRYKRPNSISAKRRERSGVPGKLGIVRVYGAAMGKLRAFVFDRDRYRCQGPFVLDADRNPVPMRTCLKPISLEYGEEHPRGHLVHLRAKRNNGDKPENLAAGCDTCHKNSHNAGGKPVPAKERR